MLLFRQNKNPLLSTWGKCLNSNVPNLWSGWKKQEKPIDKESLYKEIQKGVKHKPKSGWEEF